MNQDMQSLAAFAQQFANAGASRSLYKTIAEGASQSVQEQRVDVVGYKGKVLKELEEADISKYSDAGKTAHANLVAELKNI